MNHELCRASLLCRRHERGRHKASKSSVGPVIPRAAKRGACYSKSTSPLSDALGHSIRQRRATGNRFLPTAFNLVTVSSSLGLTCSPDARLRQILCAMTPLPQKFRDLAEEFPSTLEVRRIAQLTPSRQDRHWRFVRASRSIFDRIPAAMEMDVLFYRFPSERGYCQRLSQLRPHPGRNGKVELSVDLLCLSTPWVSGRWRDTLPLDSRHRHHFPRSGDLSDPEGSNIALDSALALRKGSFL